jgi:hypothetical protein
MTEIGVDFQVDEFKTVVLGLRIVSVDKLAVTD